MRVIIEARFAADPGVGRTGGVRVGLPLAGDSDAARRRELEPDPHRLPLAQ